MDPSSVERRTFMKMAQINIPDTVFLGLLNGVNGMQVSVMPPDVAPADLMEMLNAATEHVQKLIDAANPPQAPEPDEPDEAPATDVTAVTLAPGETQSVDMPGGGTLTVSYPQTAESPPPETPGE